MAKAPRPGTVKTRLHPLLGPRGCARLQEALIRHTTGLTAGRSVFVAYDPPHAENAMRRLVPAEARLLPQHRGHLGQRLTAAVEDTFARHRGPLLVLGTDAPTVTADLLTLAFAALDRGTDIVLGPALDGGYYLIGMRRPEVRLFGIDPGLWSGDRVLAATLTIADRVGLSTRLLPEVRDLDTPQDAAALLDDPLLPARIEAVLRRVEVP